MNHRGSPTFGLEPARAWRRLLWIWLFFWLVLLLLGVQEYRWSGGRQIWRPIADYGTAALLGTLMAAAQLRRARRNDHLLGRPLRWFVHQWAWMPLQLVAFVSGLWALRFLIYRLMDAPLRPGPWSEVLPYEALKFTLFYALLGGIQFGLLSYRAWLTERLRTEEQARLAQQAQLAQLTQQLQPHFLFNALNTISSLIHSDPNLADDLLTRLATLLRSATEAGQRPEQTLADEMHLLHAYADLMTQRFSERVDIRWEVDTDAQHCKVPTLALQPLLENCFQHVVERRRERTHIVIRAAHGAGILRIEIENDGDLTPVPKARGVGLGNLERRLHSLHGAQAKLSLEARSGGGLIVRVELPCAH